MTFCLGNKDIAFSELFSPTSQSNMGQIDQFRPNNDFFSAWYPQMHVLHKFRNAA